MLNYKQRQRNAEKSYKNRGRIIHVSCVIISTIGNLIIKMPVNGTYTCRALHQLDLSKCEACWPMTFNKARNLAYEQWQVDKISEREVDFKFKEVVSSNIKDLQKDINF